MHECEPGIYELACGCIVEEIDGSWVFLRICGHCEHKYLAAIGRT